MKYLYLILAIGWVNTAFSANPTYDATKGALQNDSILCQYGYNPNCSQERKQSQQIIEHIYVKTPSKFGALAYSPKAGHIAGSLNHSSKAEAQQAAIQRCQQGSRNTPCKAIAWVRNGCVAAAAGKVKNKFVVVDGAGHPGTAEQIALQNCKKGGLKDCEIIMPEGCSLP
jgi:hypothetical protein